MDNTQIIEFNRIAERIGASPIAISNQNHEEQEGQEQGENYTGIEYVGAGAGAGTSGVEPDFTPSEIIEWGLGLLTGGAELTTEEQSKINSASNKIINHHGFNFENVHPYTNALITGLIIWGKRKGSKIFSIFKKGKAKTSSNDEMSAFDEYKQGLKE